MTSANLMFWIPMLIYRGSLSTAFDAFLLAELANRGLYAVTKHPPNFNSTCNIQEGTVIVIDRRVASMARWLDGRAWSPSRFQEGFFTYQELFENIPTGLLKKCVAVKSPNGNQFQIISYYTSHTSSPPTALAKFMENVSQRDQIYKEANKYVHSKGIHRFSRRYQQLCVPKSRPMLLNKVPIKLPPFSSLQFPDSKLSNISFPLGEDRKQLALFTPWLSFEETK